MSDSRLRLVAAAALVTGSALGMAGTFAPSPGWRSLAWGLDGTALIVGSALLAVHHIRRANELAAAGFLVFLLGQALVLSCAAMSLEAGIPLFGAGVALWAAGLAIVSASKVMPRLVNALGILAAVLFGVVAIRIFTGDVVTPLAQPLPSFAYPALVATLCGWAWAHYRNGVA